MIRVKSFLLLGAVLSLSATAQAAKPHKKGQVALGAERLFGFVYNSQYIEFETGEEIDASGSGFSLLNNPGAQARTGTGDSVPGPLYTVPRLGIDYFVADNIGVGGLVGLSTSSLTIADEAGNEADLNSTGLLFGLRASYAYMFATKYGIWPRLGFTYLRTTAELDIDGFEPVTATLGLTALSLDVPLLILATPSFGFTLGPSFETTLGGGMTVDGGADPDEYTVTEFGVTAGIVGLL